MCQLTAQWPIIKPAQNKYNTNYTIHTHTQNKNYQVVNDLFHRSDVHTVYIKYSNSSDSDNTIQYYNNNNNNNNNCSNNNKNRT
jgi:hypothetical protein